MPSHAHLTLIGHVGGDPEMRYLPSGKPVTNFSIAISNNRFDPETRTWSEQKPDWWKCSVWNESGERANQQITKGALVMVEGKPSGRAYAGRDGDVKVSLECSVSKWLLLSKRDTPSSAETDDVPFN